MTIMHTCYMCGHAVSLHSSGRAGCLVEQDNAGYCFCVKSAPELITLKNREGDQPIPVVGGKSVTRTVIERFEERERLGIQRYGRSLETFNGRDPLVDYLEEDYDRLQYFTQILMERDVSVEESASLLVEAYVQKRKRANDPPTQAEYEAYREGVEDAARRYFIAAKFTKGT